MVEAREQGSSAVTGHPELRVMQSLLRKLPRQVAIDKTLQRVICPANRRQNETSEGDLTDYVIDLGQDLDAKSRSPVLIPICCGGKFSVRSRKRRNSRDQHRESRVKMLARTSVHSGNG